jgi:hypothetical protein
MTEIVFSERDVSFGGVDTGEGACLVCGGGTEFKTSWVNGKTGERAECFFDLCESCKSVVNCFTCRYGKPWYFRYGGRCDVNYYALKLLAFLEDNPPDDDDKDNGERTKAIAEYLSMFGLTYVKGETEMAEVVKAIEATIEKRLKDQLPDCRLYKTKMIGSTLGDFWNAPPCKRHRPGDATKKEWDEYHGEFEWDRYYDDNPDYDDYDY